MTVLERFRNSSQLQESEGYVKAKVASFSTNSHVVSEDASSLLLFSVVPRRRVIQKRRSHVHLMCTGTYTVKGECSSTYRVLDDDAKKDMPRPFRYSTYIRGELNSATHRLIFPTSTPPRARLYQAPSKCRGRGKDPHRSSPRTPDLFPCATRLPPS